MKKLFSLFAVFMMAMNPTKMWAEEPEKITITVLDGTTGNLNESPEKLFDGKKETKWCTTDFSSDGAYIIFKLNRADSMTGYTITDGADTSDSQFFGRHWDSWTIYGASFESDEDALGDSPDWTEVDSQHGQRYTNGGYSEQRSAVFTVNNAEKYQYYKLVITSIGESFRITYDEDGDYDDVDDDDCQQMAEMIFTWSNGIQVSGTNDQNDNQDSDPEKITISVLDGTTDKENESPEKLFDGDTGTKWCTGNFDERRAYVIFKINRPASMTGYTIIDGGDTNSDSYFGRHWGSWTIYGASFDSDEDAKLNAEEWEMIDNQSGQEFESMREFTSELSSDFTVNNAGKYQYYMISITGIGESYHGWDDMLDDCQQMAEMIFTWSEDEEEDNIPTGIQDINVSTSAECIYDIHGRRQQSLSKGLNIIKQADGSVKKVVVK